MDLEDSRCPPGALPLRQAMQAWLPEKVLAEVRAAGDDLNRNARQVYRIDEQGRRIFEIDAHSDFNRPLLLRMQEAQDAAGAAFLALLRAGRLVAWAREGSPVAPLRRTPADAWASLRLAHVTEGRARGHGVDLFGIRVAPAPATPRPRRPKSSRPARLGGRQVCSSSGASISADSARARRACSANAGAFTTPVSGRTAAWAAGLRGPKQSARPLAVRRHYAPPPGQRGGRSNDALISNSDHRGGAGQPRRIGS